MMVWALPSEGRGHEFESRRVRQISPLAQRVSAPRARHLLYFRHVRPPDIQICDCGIIVSRETVRQGRRRDKRAAKRLLRKLLKKQMRRPRVMITDKLARYRAAKRETMPGIGHCQHKGSNNRAENSHQPTR
jgi:hypothetical protein